MRQTAAALINLGRRTAEGCCPHANCNRYGNLLMSPGSVFIRSLEVEISGCRAGHCE